MRLSHCGSLALRPLTGTWYRAVPPQFWTQPFDTAHTRTVPSRFSAGSDAHPNFETLYLAENHIVALFEVDAMVGSFHGSHLPNPLAVHTIVPAQIQLQYVADLTKPSQRKLIRTSIQELTGDWHGYRLRVPAQPTTPPYTEVPTQRLGDALHAVPSLEGFLTYSVDVSTHKNLVIFPDKLDPGSSVVFINPVTRQSHKSP